MAGGYYFYSHYSFGIGIIYSETGSRTGIPQRAHLERLSASRVTVQAQPVKQQSTVKIIFADKRNRRMFMLWILTAGFYSLGIMV